MDSLWAPWRMEYILGPKSGPCFLCIQPDETGKSDMEHLILYRGKHGFVVMNKYPYANGHLMIVPNQHTAFIDDLDEETMLELFLLLKRSKSVLDQTLSPHGFNIGMNLGRVAGAGLDTHLHLHIVPRWNGDTNFMPVLAETRVISEHINETYLHLLKAFRALQ